MHFVEAKGILTCSGGYYGMNIYRGCTHSCIYCDSRSRCYQFTRSFEEPILPFINDTEDNITAILNECVRVGVKGIIDFGMGLTLREGDREYYYAALDKHFPGMKELYIKSYGNAYELQIRMQKNLWDYSRESVRTMESCQLRMNVSDLCRNCRTNIRR